MKRTILGLAACAVLAGCGGGDDGGGAAAAAAAPPSALLASAEGLWQGRTSTGLNANIAVLESGETWGIYGSNSVIYGAVHGQTRWGEGTVSGAATSYDTTTRLVAPTAFTGSFAPRSSIVVTTGDNVQFMAQYHPAYDEPPSLPALAGSFRGQAVSATAPPRGAAVVIAASGAVTLPEVQGCAGAGGIAPRASGKNVYDLDITFSGAGCVLGDGTTVRGIAYYDSSTRQLLAMALNPERSDGFIYLGIK